MLKTKNSKSFKDEIRKSFIIYTLIPTFILSFVFYHLLLTHSLRILKNSNIEKNRNVADLIEESFNNYIDEINDLSQLNSIKNIIKKNKGDHSWIYERLYNFVNKQHIKSIFYIIDTDGENLISNTWEKSSYTKEDLTTLGIMDSSIENNDNKIKFILNKKNSSQNTRKIYTISKAILNEENKIIAYIIFDLLDKELNNIIYKNKSNIFIITDSYQNAIISTNNLFLDSFGKFKPACNKTGYLEIYNENYFMSKTNIVQGRISVYTLSPLDFMANLYFSSIIFMFIVFIFLTILTFLVSKKFANTRTKYIYDLIDSIKKVKQGNFNTKVSICSKDEFEILGNYYNEMTMKLHELILKNTEQLKLNKIAELKQLEAQFNPHFLFNTLETLRYLIKLDSDSAIKVVVSMSNLLRYSIDYEIDENKLENDIKYIEDYLSIQKYRFNHRFDYEINLEENTKKLMIPKLIIQPIVENSFKYGFEHKAYVKIKIKAFLQEDDLIIKITDSGSGINKEDIEKIKEELDKNINLSNNLGLYNVHKRIKIMYGEKYGIKIKSLEHIKTEVTINIPKIEV